MNGEVQLEESSKIKFLKTTAMHPRFCHNFMFLAQISSNTPGR